MACYFCYSRYCDDQTNADDRKLEIKATIVPSAQKGMSINDNNGHNNSMLHSLKKNLNDGYDAKGRTMNNSQSNCNMTGKRKGINSQRKGLGSNDRIIDKNAFQNTMASNKNASLLYDCQDDQMKRINAENKIVKRINRKDYDENAVYGKPSNPYLTNKCMLFNSPQDENNKNKSLRRMSCPKEQGVQERNSCEKCKEMYIKMINDQKGFRALRCPECRNILNEETYNYYLKLYSVPYEDHSTKGKLLDEGRITGTWYKWLQLQSESRKENLAYDIISGNAKGGKQNNDFPTFKKQFSSKKYF